MDYAIANYLTASLVTYFVAVPVGIHLTTLQKHVRGLPP